MIAIIAKIRSSRNNLILIKNCSLRNFRDISRPLQEEALYDYDTWATYKTTNALELWLLNKYLDSVPIRLTLIYAYFPQIYGQIK